MYASTSKPLLFRIPPIFKSRSALIAAESMRHGGVSPAPFNSLNLGGSTNDDLSNVLQNHALFFTSIGVPFTNVAKSHQVHGAEILKVDSPGRYEGYDALITNKANVQLAVTIADCTPILIFDPVTNAVATAHAGWRGTVKQIAAKTINAMTKEFGTEPQNCLAYIGTCIDECSFEVGLEVAENFDTAFKRWNKEKQKFFIDLKSANRAQLLAIGIKKENIDISPYSTVLNNEDYFSYRLENGNTGRMLATIGLKG